MKELNYLQKEVLEVTNIAVDKLIEMRQIEGTKIAEDLNNRIEDIK